MPGLGALSGIVKTMGSGIGELPDVGLDGVMMEPRGKRR